MKRFIFTLTAMLVLTVTGFAQSIAEGVYVIKFTHDPDYVLTLKDGDASNANIVHLWKWKNDNSQKWKVTHKDGKIVIRSMVDNNYVLDALDYIYDNNTQIYVFTYHGGNNQLWVPEKLSNGSYIVKIAGNTKYCLDLYKGNAKNGGKIELYNAHKDWPEQWTFEKVSSTTSSTQKTTGTTSNTQKTGNTTSTTGSTQKTGNSNTTSGSTQNLKPNAPGSMTDYQENIGKTYTFIVKGDINGGSIYGGKNNIYTSDSDLSVACVHAGILKDGSVGKVTVKVLADQGGYPSLTRNGITSGEWGAWRGAYQILADNGSSNSNANTTNTTKNTGTTTTQKTSNTTSSTQNTKKNTSTTSSTIEDGVYVIRFTHDPDYVLTLKDGDASNVNVVHLWKWKNDNSQKWKVTHTDGKIVIRSMVDNDYVLDVLDYEYANNTQIIVYTYHGKDNQLWVPEKLSNGSYIIKTAGDTKYCLDLYKGHAANGEKIELYNAHKDWPEQWTFEKVSTTSSNTKKTTGTTSSTPKSTTTSGSTQNLKPNAPDSMTDYQENIGKTYTFIVKGNINGGSIYGGKNNIYTSDSDLSVACVHAGILKDGSVGKVTVKVLADQGSYPSLTRNGITSGEWGAWRGAYQILTDNGGSNK